MDREFLAVIDGTLGGPDAIFKLMEFYCGQVKITTADKILFDADGAALDLGRVGAIGWRGWGSNRSKSTSWWTSAMRWMHMRQDRGLAATMDSDGASGGDRSPTALPAEPRDRGGGSSDRSPCLAAHQAVRGNGGADFSQAAARTDGLRAGGGVPKLRDRRGLIEGARRCAVTLRLKGPSTYWHKYECRHAVLLVRSYYKAGRWNLLWRGRHLRRQQGSPREPKEMDRSLGNSPRTLMSDD